MNDRHVMVPSCSAELVGQSGRKCTASPTTAWEGRNSKAGPDGRHRSRGSQGRVERVEAGDRADRETGEVDGGVGI